MVIFFILIAPICIYSLYFNDPIVEVHAYRQTQTAIVAFWMIQDQFKILNYLMPVIGYPWSAPLEFPLYQFIVAKFTQSSEFKLEVVGRTISLLFFYLTLVPLALILKPYGKKAIVLAFVLYLSSPIQLIYSRAFLIENLALFLSILCFLFYIKLKENKNNNIFFFLFITLFVFFGALSGLQKITTFLPVLLICLINTFLGIEFKASSIKRNMNVIATCFLLSLSIVPPILYSKYSDSIKRLGYITEHLVSNAQSSWIFGDLSLRLSLEYWIKVFGYRLTFLGGLSVAILLALYFRLSKKNKFNQVALISILIGVTGPLIFGPLFYVHDYYFIASLVYVIIGISIYLSSNFRSMTSILIIICTIIIINYSIFIHKYIPQLETYSDINITSIKVGSYLSNHIKSNEVSLIIGMDWSSVIPYYSKHYAVMIPSWLDLNKFIINNPLKYIGSYEIGAIVICENSLWPFKLDNENYNTLISLINGDTVTIDSCKIKLKD